ncbi:unnamed protein product, partial [Ectocarpus sp. 12 AP-2014]
QGPASRSAPLGRASSSTSPAQATPTSAIAAGKHGASAGAGGGIPARKDPPVARPVVLLPRRRIFYSSTFVRKAGFPRGHVLNPCG